MSDVIEGLTESLLESLRECRELRRRVDHFKSAMAEAEERHIDEVVELERKYNTDTAKLKVKYAEESDRAEKLEAKVKELEWQVEELIKQIPSEGSQVKEFDGYRQLLVGEAMQEGDMFNRIGDTALCPVSSPSGWTVYDTKSIRYYRKIEDSNDNPKTT